MTKKEVVDDANTLELLENEELIHCLMADIDKIEKRALGCNWISIVKMCQDAKRKVRNNIKG